MPQPTSKLHAEWLSLLDVSGPFLSMPVLTAAFPQGLDVLEDGQARSLRADYGFWQEKTNDPAVHTAWIRLVLESLLGYSTDVMVTGQAISAGWKAEFPEHDETLRPDFMVVDGGQMTVDGKSRAPHLLIQVYPPGQDLEKTVRGSRWQASAATRMMELLHATEVRLGLLTNGEQWMLVNAPRGETTGFATWYANLWFDEGSTLRAFRSLLGVQRFFGVAADQTLERMLAASANDQQEITDQLGLQVRHAVEILIQKMDQADQDSHGALLTGIGGVETEHAPSLLYEAALTVMMRLVFMLSAEERKLLPLDDALYAENYAVSTLYEQLSATEEEVLERRFDAWSRLLAVFRVVHDGIFHERLNLPPYGGSLFDPEKYPFLEGRSAVATENTEKREKKEIPLPISNRTVLHLLGALQVLQIDGEARRLSFRALDVEQIGHVYEGLLDHNAVRATETMLGLRGAKRHEPEIALSQLEQISGKKESEFYGWLMDVTGRSLSALKNALARGIDMEIYPSLRAACGNDEALFARVSRFAALLRTDDFGLPVVILKGSVFVTTGTTRRATGTHYTPRSLTEPVVQHTLEPLVYSGPAEGLPREQWRLRSPQELLDLKICDMAMGSGGFLVQVVRYMAERLVESWGLYGDDATVDRRPLTVDSSALNDSQILPSTAAPSQGVDGLRSDAVSPSTVHGLRSDDDLLIDARRLIAERCLYGVDKNPLAVEIAKLSLWLVTLAKNLPFTFVDHALKCGDSLVGCSEDDFLRWAHGYQASTMTLFDADVRETLETARAKRGELESFVVRDAHDAERKSALLNEANAAMTHVMRGADLLTGARLLGLKAQDVEDLQVNMLFAYMAGELDSAIDANKHPGAARALHAAQKERAFHWEFAFPEVFAKGGFSAFVGNPPFIGGQRLTGVFGTPYRDYLLEHLAKGKRGSADLCAYFFLRTYSLLAKAGSFGLISTNTIAQGDTREVGLDVIARGGGTIYFANSSMSWPGIAAVFVSIVHTYRGDFLGQKYLDEKPVRHITAFLDSSELLGEPYRLFFNTGKSFQGSIVLGMGFVLDPAEAKKLLEINAKNKDVLFPYLNGEDLNSRADQSPRRWAINFFDWPIERAARYQECFERIESLVKPEREKGIGRNPIATKRGKVWWRYGSDAIQLYKTTSDYSRVLVRARVTKTHAFVFYTPNITFADTVVVFAYDDQNIFTVLQSSLHEIWAWVYGSTLKSDLRYSPTDCFETFPFPQNLSGLESIGETYHETRREIMLARQEGLTKIYNRFHDPAEHSEDIVRLRGLHVQMDQAVASAYGWGLDRGPLTVDGEIFESLSADESTVNGLRSTVAPVALDHDFHTTAQGVRYTISESARREVLSRLLKLNHERWEEEQKANASREVGSQKDEGKGKKNKGKKVSEESGQYGLF